MSLVVHSCGLLFVLTVLSPGSTAFNISDLENVEETKSREEKEPQRNLFPATFPALLGLEPPPGSSDNTTRLQSGEKDTVLAPAVTKTFYIPTEPILPEMRIPFINPPRELILPPGVLDNPSKHVLATEHVCGSKGACDKGQARWECESVGFQCHACRCDEDCFRFGDCCPDKYNFTDFQPSVESDSCISVSIKASQGMPDHRYLMVDTCIDQSSSEKLTDQCQNRSSNMEPVYSPQTKHHYKNRHCALCNGVQDAIAWPVKAACPTVLDYSKLRTAEDFFLEAWQNPSCAVFAVPPADSDARECSHDSSMVSECPAEWPDQTFVTDCQKYRYPITVKSRGTFRNIFCAICNGVVLSRALDACDMSPDIIDAYFPYSAVYDYDLAAKSNTSVSDKCPRAQLFDDFQHKCRPMYCPPGKLTKDYSCVDLFSSARGTAYALYFTLRPGSDNGALLYQNRISDIVRQYITDTTYIDRYVEIAMEKTQISITFSTPNDLAGDPMQEGLRVFNITVKRRFVVGRHVPRSHLDKMLMDFVRQGWSFYNEPEEAYVKFHAQWLSESTGEEFLTADIPVFSKTKHLQTTTETTILSRDFLAPFPPQYVSTSSVYLPVNELMDCNLIELSPDEFEPHGENDIIEKATGKVLKTGQYVAVGKAVHVCTNFTGKIVGKHQETASVHRGRVSEAVSSRETSSTTLIVICTGLSLFCILLSFLCHAFSQRFRTLSSKSNMAFFVNLFCAQLSLLMAIVLPVSGTVCSVLGAIIHYFWLSTLSWGLVSTYIAYKIVNKLYNPNNTSKMLTIFCLLCQCLPCILVAAYISVHVISSQTPGYGLLRVNRDGQVCFLATSVDVIVGFITPIGILLLLSQVFHVRLLCIFPQTNDEVENDTELGRTISKSYCTVLVPLSCTWVFGSLAVILGDSYLWYGFLLFHASTGMFVIYSFIIVAGCFDIRDKRYEQSSCLNGSSEKHVAQPLDTEETVNAYSSHM